MTSWKTPRTSLASCMHILWMLSLAICGHTFETSQNVYSEFLTDAHCPNPAVIAPCTCKYNAALGMDMDCSSVTSEDELRKVFSNNFTFTDFREFIIQHNKNLTSLREGDLGSASFREIIINWTQLSEIETEALKGSFQTLDTLNIYDNSLTTLPDISNFTRLKTLEADFNQINKFPILASETLSHLNLGNNQIDDVPVDAIVAMPVLETLLLHANSLTEIHPHTFTQNENLEVLNLAENRLTTIPDNAITLHGQRTWLSLNSNQIASVSHEVASNVNYILYVNNNLLTEVPEEVFRPILEDSINVFMFGNPFKCGCDMAWLVIDETLMDNLLLSDATICPDGEAFDELDPEVYKVMCPNATALPL